MITIGSTKVKNPSSLTVSLYDITEAERNAKGTMVIDLIARKYKLELTWSYLTQQELTEILNAIQTSITFKVSFTDPVTGNTISKTCYSGDRTAPMLSYSENSITWKDFKVNLIEV